MKKRIKKLLKIILFKSIVIIFNEFYFIAILEVILSRESKINIFIDVIYLIIQEKIELNLPLSIFMKLIFIFYEKNILKTWSFNNILEHQLVVYILISFCFYLNYFLYLILNL